MHRPTEDPPNPDELTYLGIAAPADLDMQLGYDPQKDLWADNRYVAFYWLPGADLTLTDGYATSGGNWRNFQEWDDEAGRQFLRRAAEYHDDTDLTPEDVAEQEILPSLSSILRDQGWDTGSSDSAGNAAFLYDRDLKEVFIGEREHVKRFCNRFNDGPPDWVKGLPDDPEEVLDLFKRAQEELQDESLFGDRDDEGE